MQRSSQRFSLRLILGQLLLTTLVLIPLKPALAQDFHWDDRPSYDPYPSHDNYQRGRLIRQTVMRTLYDRSLLDVGLELRLPPGQRLLSLSVVASTITRFSSLQLLEDSRASGIPLAVTRDARSQPLIVSPYSRRIELEARGDVLVHELVAEVEDHWGPGPGGRDIQLHLNQQVYSSAILPLRQLAQQQGHRLEGERIRRIHLIADAQGYSRAEARLLVNNLPVGYWQSLSGYDRQISLQLPEGQNEVGRDIRSLQLEIRGDALVRTVEIELSRHAPGPGPRPDDRILRLHSSRDLHGRQSQNLIDALWLPREHARRLVSTLIIEASSMNVGTLALVDISRGPLNAAMRLDRIARQIRVVLPQPIPLQDIGLNTNGHVRVETLTVEFLR